MHDCISIQLLGYYIKIPGPGSAGQLSYVLILSLYTPLPALILFLPHIQGTNAIIKLRPRDAPEPRHLEISRSAQSGFKPHDIGLEIPCISPAQFFDLLASCILFELVYTFVVTGLFEF